MRDVGAGICLLYLLAVIGLLAGWVMNMVAIVHALGGPWTTMLVARLVGVPVFILGAILGWVS